MIIRTHFRHLEIEPGFEEVVRNAVKQRLGRLGYERDHVLDIFISASGSLFECHMHLWSPVLNRKIFAKEMGEDFWSTLTECGEVIQTQMKKLGNQRERSRRKARGERYDLAA